jgi:hypothetical protein
VAQNYDQHHLICSSREDDELNPHTSANMLLMKRTRHEALHILYKNATPQEILRLFVELHYKILTEETRNKIMELSRMAKDEFYDGSVLKK